MQKQPDAATAEHGRPPIEITVDGRALTLEDGATTPNAILGLAGLDPTNYLVRIEGRHPVLVRGPALRDRSRADRDRDELLAPGPRANRGPSGHGTG
jgi:hypothetical protein